MSSKSSNDQKNRITCNIAGDDLFRNTEATLEAMIAINALCDEPEFLTFNDGSIAIKSNNGVEKATLVQLRQRLVQFIDFRGVSHGELVTITPPNILLRNLMCSRPSNLPKHQILFDSSKRKAHQCLVSGCAAMTGSWRRPVCYPHWKQMTDEEREAIFK